MKKIQFAKSAFLSLKVYFISLFLPFTLVYWFCSNLLYDLLPKTPNEDKIMRMQLVLYLYRAQVPFLFFCFLLSFTLGAFTIKGHHMNENVIKIINLDQQLCPFIMLFNNVKPPSKLINIHAVGISSNGLFELSHLGLGGF